MSCGHFSGMEQSTFLFWQIKKTLCFLQKETRAFDMSAFAEFDTLCFL